MYGFESGVVRREINSPEKIKYSLSNAPSDTPTKRLAFMQTLRYSVERPFQDEKKTMWTWRVSGSWLDRLAPPYVTGDAGYVVYA